MSPRQPTFNKDEGGVAAVDRAFAIVLALEAAASPITLADLARATGIYKSTLLRLLVSLERHGLVSRRASNRYCLGPLAFRLGRAYESTDQLRTHILPILTDLVESGTESASFHVRHGPLMRFCMLRVDSRHSTLDRVRAGDLLPIDRGAAGKVLLKFGDEDAPKNRRLPDPVATSHGERDPACAAIACPVFGPGQLLCGAISLSGPRERFTAPQVRRMSKLLLRAGASATETLGGQWPWEKVAAA